MGLMGLMGLNCSLVMFVVMFVVMLSGSSMGLFMEMSFAFNGMGLNCMFMASSWDICPFFGGNVHQVNTSYIMMIGLDGIDRLVMVFSKFHISIRSLSC